MFRVRSNLTDEALAAITRDQVRELIISNSIVCSFLYNLHAYVEIMHNIRLLTIKRIGPGLPVETAVFMPAGILDIVAN